jgi:glyoxylase-like metal-dependent hydrolase (beta-lactamase superfamily II)/ferredoxin
MARSSDRLAANAPGEFFVVSSCIDCGTCRGMAPDVFDRAGERARVHTQPATPAAARAAEHALLACPTGSIGSASKRDLAAARADFPLPVDGDVFHCGYHSESSFGAASYLVVRPPERGGNVLVDSPRWSRGLVRRLEELGGVATLFLTHVDDVAEHARLAEHFGCTRVMHAADAVPGVERLVEGLEPVALDDELRVIPVPGHTRGSACLLYRERVLFTGDHLAWSAPRGHLVAFRSAVWFDWETQIASMERLERESFEWVLPGHGRRARIAPGESGAAVRRCVEWMKGVR